MSIPNYEMQNLVQEEFLTFILDDTCFHYSTPIDHRVSLYSQLDRAEARAKAFKRQRDALSKLEPIPFSQEQLCRRKEQGACPHVKVSIGPWWEIVEYVEPHWWDFLEAMTTNARVALGDLEFEQEVIKGEW
jgi:hypothetical protein